MRALDFLRKTTYLWACLELLVLKSVILDSLISAVSCCYKRWHLQPEDASSLDRKEPKVFTIWQVCGNLSEMSQGSWFPFSILSKNLYYCYPTVLCWNHSCWNNSQMLSNISSKIHKAALLLWSLKLNHSRLKGCKEPCFHQKKKRGGGVQLSNLRSEETKMDFVPSSQRQKHQRCTVYVLFYSPLQSYLFHVTFTLGQAVEGEEKKKRKKLLLFKLPFSLNHFSGLREEVCTKGAPGRQGCVGTGGVVPPGDETAVRPCTRRILWS